MPHVIKSFSQSHGTRTKQKEKNGWSKGGRCRRFGFHEEKSIVQILRDKSAGHGARGDRPSDAGLGRGIEGKREGWAFITKQPAPGRTSKRIRLDVGNYLNASCVPFLLFPNYLPTQPYEFYSPSPNESLATLRASFVFPLPLRISLSRSTYVSVLYRIYRLTSLLRETTTKRNLKTRRWRQS